MDARRTPGTDDAHEGIGLEPAPAVTGRAAGLGAIALAALALIGFVVGLDQGAPRDDEAPPVASAALAAGDVTPGPRLDPAGRLVVPSTAYAAIPELIVSRNRARERDVAARLAAPKPDLLVAPTPTFEEKLASLAFRAERRAYNGAPPIIPHAVDQLDNDACLACHGRAIAPGGRPAGALPHPTLSECQQCHVAASPLFPSRTLSGTRFDGLPAPTQGARAWTGAPPVIPHSTHMRDDCLACHGPQSLPGLQTTHPWRVACTQCHAPSATLEQQPRTGGPAFIVAGSGADAGR